MNHKLAYHEDFITFFRRCAVCGEETGITVDADKYYEWRQNGRLIQDVWPELDADTREMYISGTHPACWDAAFGGYDDE